MMKDNVIPIWRKQEKEKESQGDKTKRSLYTCVRTSAFPFSQWACKQSITKCTTVLCEVSLKGDDFGFSSLITFSSQTSHSMKIQPNTLQLL